MLTSCNVKIQGNFPKILVVGEINKSPKGNPSVEKYNIIEKNSTKKSIFNVLGNPKSANLRINGRSLMTFVPKTMNVESLCGE